MANRLTFVAIFLFVLVAAGCSAISPSVTTTAASVAAADDQSLPAGTYPAVLWTIDGKRVSFRRSEQRLSPGTHTVSVLPLQDGPLGITLAYGASAQARGINVAAITVDVEGGQALKLAAVVRRHRTYSEEGGEVQAPWQTTVVPYIVSGGAQY